jgi:hypothetical protein
MYRITPKNACVIAIQIPPHNSHRTFMKMYRQPEARGSTLLVRPKGQRASHPILRVWRPKGIPTMVIIRIRLPMKYSTAMMIPPNISQIRLPRIFISYDCLLKDNGFILRVFYRISQDQLPGFLWLDFKIPFDCTSL